MKLNQKCKWFANPPLYVQHHTGISITYPELSVHTTSAEYRRSEGMNYAHFLGPVNIIKPDKTLVSPTIPNFAPYD